MTLSRREFAQSAAVFAAGMMHPGLRTLAADSPKEKPKSQFLQGNYAPLRQELTEAKLKITGQIPKSLEGMFVRNGPNPQFDPIGNYHWFDGDGMLHGIHIENGQASYRNRFIHTAGFLDEKKAGKAIFPGILDVPDLKKVAAGENPYKNPANTSVVFHDDKLLALWEVGEPYEIKVPSLETVGGNTFGGKLKHPFTAHPKIDPKTGEMLTFGYIPNQPLLFFSTISAKGEWQSTVKVKLDRPTMIHDFAISENFAIFPICPQTFDIARMFRRQSPWYFNPKWPMKWAIVPRNGQGDVKFLEAESCFTFHLMNAHEKGDEIIIDGSRYPHFPGELSFDAAAADQEAKPVPYRWTLNVKTGTVKESVFDDISAEFPRLNDAYVGAAHRFGYYGIGTGDFFDGVRKYDLASAQFEEHRYGAGRFGGEAVFVAAPSAKAEDAGWLLNIVYDKAEDQSELVITDAQGMKAAPVARIHLPTRVPYGFHGTWIAGEKLRS